ncbi:cell lysis protein-like protein [Trichodelitschia bisporula]|uniref:Reticulon-like protein n=1 Tax=Trichodelitschia bisporula TaxID=703511 RepID=A0A6G1I714_9PEZI|nr:cell lysis protein-like protein [Trichodelitschia bisporula]
MNGHSRDSVANSVANSAQKAKDTVFNTASAAMTNIQNHPVTQNLTDTVANGPVGESVKTQAAKTTSEFQDLADSRRTPEQPAATGQPLTHYHSLFYRLLSWKNPRATAISFALSVLFIFAARYLNIIRYIFKALYLVLGITASAEIAGRTVFGSGLATQLRPRTYFVIPKESLERFLDDAEQFINFFVIEFQRVVFVENVWVTSAAFCASFISYWLVKWVPLWGLSLIATSTAYLAPLIYLQNKEAIDAHLQNAGHVINQQATQVKDLAAQHTGRATESVRTYASEYSKVAQDYIGTARQKTGTVKPTDFPSAPHADPVAPTDPVAKKAPAPEPAY